MMIDRLWTATAINTCVRHGIDHFFVAPGSRCTPLTLAVADQTEAQVVQHFDERALAFAALGYARGSGKPGVFICTSGTAVANAFPAVIEAAMEGIPLLLFTADRPPELRGSGANQTIDQQRIFGNYVRLFTDLPVPEEQLASQPGLEYVDSELMKAFEYVQTGPVHLNWMFREPFGLDEPPEIVVAPESDATNRLPASAQKGTTVHLDGNTLIVMGGCRVDESAAIRHQAAELGIPVLGDVTSGIRSLNPEVVLDRELPRPDTVLHVGQRIVSKSWLKYTATLDRTRFIQLTTHDAEVNPNRLAVEHIVASIRESGLKFSPARATSANTTTSPASMSPASMSPASMSPAFRAAWEQAGRRRQAAVAGGLAIDGAGRLSEPHLAYELAQSLVAGDGLFIGNSTPIRDLDWYGSWDDGLDLVVAANRGASGIDGLLASGVGFARGTQRPTTIVLGDLSALHDLNSLALVANSPVPITIVVINNLGGGIFDLLPIANSQSQRQSFERFFATPHEFRFEHGAKMFGIDYASVDTVPGFVATLEQAKVAKDSVLIEARTDRRYNTVVRERIKSEWGV